MLPDKPNLRQAQAMETRGKLLSAALRLFASEGYATTSLKTLHRSVGLSDGLLYHYFPGGKKELLEVLISETGAQVLSEVKARTQDFPKLPIADMLEQFFQMADAIFETHLDFFKIIVKEPEGKAFLHRSQLMQAMEAQRQWFPAYLEACALRGEIRPMDYDMATQVLVSLLMANFFGKITGNGEVPLNDPVVRKRLIAYHVSLWQLPSV